MEFLDEHGLELADESSREESESVIDNDADEHRSCKNKQIYIIKIITQSTNISNNNNNE